MECAYSKINYSYQECIEKGRHMGWSKNSLHGKNFLKQMMPPCCEIFCLIEIGCFLLLFIPVMEELPEYLRKSLSWTRQMYVFWDEVFFWLIINPCSPFSFLFIRCGELPVPLIWVSCVVSTRGLDNSLFLDELINDSTFSEFDFFCTGTEVTCFCSFWIFHLAISRPLVTL